MGAPQPCPWRAVTPGVSGPTPRASAPTAKSEAKLDGQGRVRDRRMRPRRPEVPSETGAAPYPSKASRTLTLSPSTEVRKGACRRQQWGQKGDRGGGWVSSLLQSVHTPLFTSPLKTAAALSMCVEVLLFLIFLHSLFLFLDSIKTWPFLGISWEVFFFLCIWN